MKIKVLKDFRKLKKGEEFEFPLLPMLIVGENGSGKTSLMLALRGQKNSLPEVSLNNDLHDLKDNIEVESNYEKFFFFGSVEDNGTDFRTSYDAIQFLESGAYHANHLSHGEGMMLYLDKFIKKVLNNYIPDKTLVVFDEIDTGWDLKKQHALNNIAINLSAKGIDCIFISHSLIAIKDFRIFYDFDKRKYTSSKEYLKNMFGDESDK